MARTAASPSSGAPKPTKKRAKPERPSEDYGWCSVCRKVVRIAADTGRAVDHETPSGAPCPGSGEDRFRDVPDRCPVCDTVQSVRGSDGRIAAHKIGGQRCEGSGRSPAGGRKDVTAAGVSAVVSGGAPGLGKRR